MRQWVLDAEHILDGSWAEGAEQGESSEETPGKNGLSNKEVSKRFVKFLQEYDQKLVESEMSQIEHKVSFCECCII